MQAGRFLRPHFIILFSFTGSSSSLQWSLHTNCLPVKKSAIEIHDAEDRTQASTPLSSVKVPGEAASKTVSYFVTTVVMHLTIPHTFKGNQETVAQSLIPPVVNSQGRVGGRRTVNRGDFDEAIRSIRDGKRRVRPNRPLSKIFLDGGGRPQSRIFD